MPSTRRRQRGAGPWRQGADTCVFKPALACKDNPTVRPGPEYVSRVTEPMDRAFPIEKLLKKTFSSLVSKGWITAFDKPCKPFYAPEDKVVDPSFYETYPDPEKQGACQLKIFADNRYADQQLNLISKRIGPAFRDFITPTPMNTAMSMFRNAMSAAVALVPDNGPWVLHTDLHSNNILRSLTEPEPSYVLHDWGRSLVITVPKQRQSFIEGVVEFVDNVYPPAVYGKVPIVWQMPPMIINSVQKIYDTRTVTPQDAQCLRVWTIFSVFKNILQIAIPIPNAKITYDVRDRRKVEQLTNDMFVYLAGNAGSQEALIRAINVIVTNLNFPNRSSAVNFVKQA